MEGWIIAVIVFLAYLIIVTVGHQLKLWEKLNITLWGPIIIWKTIRGREFIERIARRSRFWNAYGRISIGICIISMILLMALMLWNFFLIPLIPRESAPSPEMVIGIPGLNPIIPLWYGILGLVIAVFVHEFAHGILTRVGKMKIESMGILLLIVPIGAFVEPNEDEIKETTRKKRMRLFATGPATNIVVAIICVALLLGIFAPSAKPIYDGAIVVGLTKDSPADNYGIALWSEITAVDDIAILNSEDLESVFFGSPGSPVNLTVFYERELSIIELPAGVAVSPVSDEPADIAGIKQGNIIKNLNDVEINSLEEFKSVLDTTPYDEPVNVTVLEYREDTPLGKPWFVQNETITNITLVSKWEYYEENFPELNKDEYRNASRMGVSASVFGIFPEDADYIIRITAHPLQGAEDINDALRQTLRFIALPFQGYSPIRPPMTDLYEPTGAFTGVPDDLYWMLVNSLYWIFWLNAALGLFNALPAVPLDGGYIFRDILKGFIERLNRRSAKAGLTNQKGQMTDKQMENIVGKISLFISLIVLFLILWPLIGPRLP